MEGNRSVYIRILPICCFLSVLSQLPVFVQYGYSSVVAQGIWLFFTLVLLLCERRVVIIKPLLLTFICSIVFTIFVFVMDISGTMYSSTNLYRSFMLSTFIFIIGCNINIKNLSVIEKICNAYGYGTIILSMSIYYQYLRGNSITEKEYLYGSKNSAAIIILTGIIALSVFVYKRNTLSKLLRIIIILFQVIVIALMKCRSALVALMLVVFYCIYVANISKKYKFVLTILCVAFLLSLMNDNVYYIVVENVFAVGRTNDLDSLSGGRMSGYLSFFDDMSGKWVFGDGFTFRESLPLALFLKYGLFIGLLVLGYAYWPFFFCIKHLRKIRKRECLFLILINIVYVSNSIFEQLSPFGPGVRCFMLWLVFGIVLRNMDVVFSNNSLEMDTTYE